MNVSLKSCRILVVTVAALWGSLTSAQVNALIARTTADQSTTSTSLSNVAGLTWPVAANASYAFNCHLAQSRSNIGTELYLSVNGPAPFSALRYSVTTPFTGATDDQYASDNAYDTGQTYNNNVAGATPDWPAEVRGTFENGANAGTFAIRYLSNTGSGNSVNILRGSFCTVARQ